MAGVFDCLESFDLEPSKSSTGDWIVYRQIQDTYPCAKYELQEQVQNTQVATWAGPEVQEALRVG